ncbi:unnamed protein product, partial [Allacma fusca]
VGYEGAYDLRIFDNSPVGVRHPGVVCDGCNEVKSLKRTLYLCVLRAGNWTIQYTLAIRAPIKAPQKRSYNE